MTLRKIVAVGDKTTTNGVILLCRKIKEEAIKCRYFLSDLT